MTVAQLIEELKEMPQELPVHYWVGDEQEDVEEVILYFKKDGVYLSNGSFL